MTDQPSSCPNCLAAEARVDALQLDNAELERQLTELHNTCGHYERAMARDTARADAIVAQHAELQNALLALVTQWREKAIAGRLIAAAVVPIHRRAAALENASVPDQCADDLAALLARQ